MTADNRVLYVRVVKQEPGSFVTFTYPDGREETLSWSQVKVVALIPNWRPPAPPSAPPAPAPAPVPTVRRSDSLSGQDNPRQTQDCAPGDVRCNEHAAMTLGGKGAGFGLSGQEVKRVKTPPRSDLGLAIEAAGLYGTSTDANVNITIVGFALQGGLRTMLGGQFPGPEGGGWSGLGAELMVGAQGGAGEVGAGGQTIAYEQSTYLGAASAGFQYLNFGSMNPETLEQGGFGLFLGYRFGYSTTTVSVAETTSESSSSTHGPVLTLSFPKYNAGTATLRRWTITVMGMYIEDFVLLTAGAGYTW